jgi:sialate O-acetylesterase
MTGVPTRTSGIWYQENVSNLNVYSNVQSLCAEGLLEGNLEFWPTNYGAANIANVLGASNTLYDWGDSPVINQNWGYGSMQLHVASLPTTVFAFNNWNPGNVAGLGIGNNLIGPYSDWTATANSNSYSVKTLEVWVKPSALIV